ncbi:hypothetical protein [Thalassospira tepidiphila]|uniref:hypothetical protein n=1 Tax=Thalassospira tepidiphila TaxID=393657 RepID=UPI003AA81EF8
MTAKLPVSAISDIAALTRTGFFVADTNVRFEWQKNTPVVAEHFPEAVRSSQPADETKVRQIAGKSIQLSRFHADKLFHPTLSQKIKEEWAGNFFNGTRGDEMLVVESCGIVEGFCQVISRERMAIVDLIAVNIQKSSQGLGTSMLNSLKHKYQNITAGTQINNTSSINFYIKSGFKVHSCEHVLHLHIS